MRPIISSAVVGFCSFFGVALALRTQEPASDAKSRFQIVAPYIDQHTISVTRLDLKRIDVKAMTAHTMTLGNLKAEDAADAIEGVRVWLEALRKAGASEIYLLDSVRDYFDDPTPSFVIVPIRPRSDSAAVVIALRDWKPGWESEVVGSVVVGVPDKRLLPLVHGFKPAARPELAKAFDALGDAAVHIALSYPQPMRRTLGKSIEEMRASLAKKKHWRKLEGTSLERYIEICKEDLRMMGDTTWGALGLNAAPPLSYRLQIATVSAELVENLHRLPFSRRFMENSFGNLLPYATLQSFWHLNIPKKAAVLTKQGCYLTLDDEHLNKLLESDAASWHGGKAGHATRTNLKRIMLSMYNFEDAKRQLPPAASYGADGRRLLSWRVHLLPWLGQQPSELYLAFRLDEPWDSPHNKTLIPKMPSVFRSPYSKLAGQGKTVYLVPVGKQTAFFGAKGFKIGQDFPDGLSTTIGVVEVTDDHAVCWTSPADLNYDSSQPFKGLRSNQRKEFPVAMMDGSVRVIGEGVTVQTMRAAFTCNGDDVPGPDFEQ